ncbi:hypothetical protein JFT64_27750 [Pseudomonas carnis]|jgi:hypothetical protein|uniref:hypothetical protein n=1 Tax=Pseudomonas carnis TaxID=2487355 RepID=UPI0018E8ABC5|nr:hypothetical protein [Pseudomonas carnis]MBJ2215831.1 hypothetical protein [Pseudomonas carnis]
MVSDIRLIYPTPISLICETIPVEVKAGPVYFNEMEASVSCFDTEMAPVVDLLQGMYAEIRAGMKWPKFFISVCPYEIPRYARDAHRGEQCLPDFRLITSYLTSLVGITDIDEVCHFEISIENREPGSKPCRLEFRVSPILEDRSYGSFSGNEKGYATINLNPQHPVMVELVNWYSKCHGLIAWDANPSILDHEYVALEDPFSIHYCSIPPNHGVYEAMRRTAMQSRNSLTLPRFQ